MNVLEDQKKDNNQSNKINFDKFIDRDDRGIIPDEVKSNPALLKRYKMYNRETAISITESYKRFNRSAIYILPLIDLEIDSFEGKMVNTYVDNESYKLYVTTTNKVLYPLNNQYYETFIKGKDYWIYLFDISSVKEQVDYYLDSKVNLFDSNSRSKVLLHNWLSFINMSKTKSGEIKCTTDTYLVEPELYGFKLIYSLHNIKMSITDQINPLYKYYKSLGFDIDINSNISLMDKVDLKSELVKYKKDSLL